MNREVTMSDSKRGRPSKYREEFPAQAARLCMLGATDKELADFFEVTLSTISEWKVVHQEFSDALKEGKQLADAKVAESLFKRATGYTHKAVKIMAVGGAVVREEYDEHYPPDATSMIFWLKNRRPDLWRDKREEEQSENKGLEKVLGDLIAKLPG